MQLNWKNQTFFSYIDDYDINREKQLILAPLDLNFFFIAKEISHYKKWLISTCFVAEVIQIYNKIIYTKYQINANFSDDSILLKSGETIQSICKMRILNNIKFLIFVVLILTLFNYLPLKLLFGENHKRSGAYSMICGRRMLKIDNVEEMGYMDI